MIEAVGISKFFGDFPALRDVSFTVNSGEVVAFLGPNGAGKTTTMRILTGFYQPSKGTARIAGIDVTENRLGASEKIGYLPENGPLYPEMSPREILTFFGEARGLSGSSLEDRLQAVRKDCALEKVFDRTIANLSKGYRQRVGMAQVLLHEPDVLIMDEPTSGLDPNQIKHVRETLRRIGETKTILLSTHILQEVEAVADRVVMISEGRLVFTGTPAELRDSGDGNIDRAFYKLTGAMVS